MKFKLQAYADTNRVDLPWLQNAPSHWEVRRAKQVFWCIDIRSKTGDEELLTVSSADGVRKRSSKAVTMFMAESYVGHKLCWEGDLVVNSLWAWATGLGFSRYHGIISTAYSVYRPKPAYSENWEFFHHLFRSRPYDWEFTVRSKGIWISRLQMTDESFMHMPVLVPPPDEQAQIVRFIRHLDQRVNRLIKTKRRLIELLNEQKQAVIRELLEGTGEELDRWQIGHFARVGNGSTPYRGNSSYWSDSGDGYPWLNSASVNQFRIGSASQFVSEIALRECHLPKVKPGSILVAITGQGKTRGTAAMLDIEATINQHVAYITVIGDRVQPEYLHLVLVASYQDLRNLSEASGSTKAALTCADIKSFKVPVRERSVQTSLVLQIRTESSKIDQAISKTRDEIELLKEYRTRLVADVVTGQLDVRHLYLPEVEESLIEAIDADSPEDLELPDEEAED